MTRLELVRRACLRVNNFNLIGEARALLDDLFTEIEMRGFWRFLEKSTTYQTTNSDNSVALSESSFPSSAITDFSKGMTVASDEPRTLYEISKAAIDSILGADTGNPLLFSQYVDTLYFYPTPVTGSLPLLTIKYFREVTLPTSGSTELSTTPGIPKKYHSSLIYGVMSGLYGIMRQPELERAAMETYEKKLFTLALDNSDYFLYNPNLIDPPTFINNSPRNPISGSVA